MKCKACDGRGVLVASIYENDEVGFVDKTYQCCCCHGTGEIEQTNEKWFCQLPTEEKAKFMCNIYEMGKNGKEYFMRLDKAVEWLKQPHKEGGTK